MKVVVQGSSPKRHIKRTHNRNPTLHSYQMFNVLQYDPLTQESTTNHLKRDLSFQQNNTQNSSRAQNLQFDSLKKAEFDFENKNKYRNPEFFRQLSQQHHKNTYSKHRSRSNNIIYSPLLMLEKLNFQNGSTIKSKQNISYNIISNVPYSP